MRRCEASSREDSHFLMGEKMDLKLDCVFFFSFWSFCVLESRFRFSTMVTMSRVTVRFECKDTRFSSLSRVEQNCVETANLSLKLGSSKKDKQSHFTQSFPL